MGHSQAEKAETHERIVAIAARRFREAGLDSISIADVMTEAGLTHGGFYKHFGSRDELVAEALSHALAQPSRERQTASPTLQAVVRDYLSKAHRDAPGTGCAVSALVGDVARAEGAPKELFAARVQRDLDRLARLVGDSDAGATRAHAHAIVTLSAMVGALGLSRAVSDEHLSDEILKVVRAYLAEAFPAR
jgi:TetR/AcrR family transcriptional repressor of nem operon